MKRFDDGDVLREILVVFGTDKLYYEKAYDEQHRPQAVTQVIEEKAQVIRWAEGKLMEIHGIAGEIVPDN